MSILDDIKIITLPKICDPRGNLSVIENGIQIPFDIQRVYYLYDVPAGVERGGHAHKECLELLIACSGCFDVVLDDGKAKRKFTLNRPFQGLLIPTGIWRTLENFSAGSICLVLASHLFDEEDYIREYDDFLRYYSLAK